MKYPKLDYDSEADVLYVTLTKGDVSGTTSPDDLMMIDLSADGSVIGVEFVSASEGIDLEDVPEATRIARAIGYNGLPVKVVA